MKSMQVLMVVFCFLMATHFAIGASGGDGSGGGDANGIEAARSLRDAVSNLDRFGKKLPLTDEQRREIHRIADQALILIVDEALPAKVGATTQEGLAYSTYESGNPVIRIQRDRWRSTPKTYLRQSTLLHELLVLGGIEFTGNYPVSSKFQALAESEVEVRLQFKCTDKTGNSILLGQNQSAELVLTRDRMQADYPVIIRLNGDSYAYQLFRGPVRVTDYAFIQGPLDAILKSQMLASPLANDAEGVSLALIQDGEFHFASDGVENGITVGGEKATCNIKVMEVNAHFQH